MGGLICLELMKWILWLDVDKLYEVGGSGWNS